MASGYGLARAFEGGVQGWKEGEARRDRATQRERSDVQFEQGQEDREYKLRRQDIETARSDEQYKVQKDAQDRFRAGSEAMRGWMTSGDIEGLNEFANKYTRDGVDHQLSKNDDGTYSYTMSVDGKSGESKNVTEDEIGTYTQLLMSQDPYAEMKEQQGLKREAAETASERKHDLAKITHEYALKRGLKSTAEGGEGDGKGGKRDKAITADNKQQAKLSKDYYGTVYDGMFQFDTNSKKRLSATHSTLADAYRMTGDGNTNTAHDRAARAMAQMEEMAIKQADEELDSGEIEEKDKEGRVSNLISSYADTVIKRMAPKPGDILGREGDPGGGQKVKDKPTGQPGSGIPSVDQYIEDVVNDPPPEASGMSEDELRAAAREDWQTRYGEEAAAAEEAAPVGPALERPTTEGEEAAVQADTSMSIPGISDANAGEAPNLKRQKQAEEDAAAEEGRRKEQRSGVKPEALKRKKAERTEELKGKAEEAKLGRGNKKARAEQARNLRRYRKLKSTARAKTMSKKQLGLALLAAESKKEKDDIKRILKEKGTNGDK